MVRVRMLLMPLLATLLIGWAGPAQARLKVKLGSAKFRPYRIAIPDFLWKGLDEGMSALGRKMAKIIRNDLALTGSLKVIPSRAYLERPPKNGIDPGTFVMGPWNNVGAEGLLKCEIKEAPGNKVIVLYRFYEVGTGRKALAGKLTFAKRNMRWYTHVIADRVYKFLTQERSFFMTKIACVRNYRGRREIHVMDFDGSNLIRLSNNGSINALPEWSPSGRFLAYTSWKAKNPDLYVHQLATGRLRKISQNRGLNTGAAWSPDGRTIAFSASLGQAGMDIWLVSPRGTGQRQLTMGKSGVQSLSPSWSPDGRQLAFVSNRRGSPQVFIMNANGSGVKRLTFKGNYNQAPKWSPRGDWILFTGRDERNVFDLFLISPKTGQVKRLTQNQGNNLEASWAPNGRSIVVSSTRAGVSKLFVMDSEGKNAKQITFLPGEFTTPAWSPWLGR